MPSASDFASNYPRLAQDEGVEGRAVLGCTVNAQGTLENCSVVSETPPNYGFGQAVLNMARLFHFSTSSITPGMALRLPVAFRVPQGETATPPAPENVIRNPAWLSQPTAAELAAAAPVSSQGGRALLDCVLNAQGGLDGCHAVASVPPTGGFGDAAVALAPRYRVIPTTPSGASVAGTPVRFSVTFPARRG
jgi:TonB family protein